MLKNLLSLSCVQFCASGRSSARFTSVHEPESSYSSLSGAPKRRMCAGQDFQIRCSGRHGDHPQSNLFAVRVPPKATPTAARFRIPPLGLSTMLASATGLRTASTSGAERVTITRTKCADAIHWTPSARGVIGAGSGRRAACGCPLDLATRPVRRSAKFIPPPPCERLTSTAFIW